METPEIRIRNIEDVRTEKMRLKTQLKFQISATEKSFKNIQEQLKPENLISDIANHMITKYFPGFQNVWKLSGDLRKYYFLKLVSRYFSKKKEG